MASTRHFARRVLAAPPSLQFKELKLATSHIPQGARCCGAATAKAPVDEDMPLPPQSLWTRFVHWSYSKLGHHIYPPKADICNCGVDLQIQLPQPELVLRDGIERGSAEWRMQLYGAALYWHAATTPREKMRKPDLDMLRGKDVLEVACMRGGGARYLTEVAGVNSYVATDNVQEHLDACSRLAPHPNLRFEHADALALSHHFAPASFDAVICVQAVASFADIPRFVREASRVLRPGGRLIICEALVRDKFKFILDTVAEESMTLHVCADVSRAVHAVGLCKVPAGISYLHICAQKPAEASEAEAGAEKSKIGTSFSREHEE